MRINKTPITNLFILFCLLISVPAICSPAYFEIFTGTLPHQYVWQNFTMVFLHGEKGMPIPIFIHLSLNIFLLVICGRQVEQILGMQKFFVLTIGTWFVFIGTQLISGVWVNGASGIIWAYSPFLLLPIQWAKNNTSFAELASQNRILLLFMWVVITIAMGFIPLLFNPNHNLLYTFTFGNLDHAAATLTGFLFYFFWKPIIKMPVEKKK